MKIITRDAVNAFMAQGSYGSKNSNTKVHSSCNGVFMSLFDNRILHRVGNRVKVSTCGWATNTTRERINGFFEIAGIKAKLSMSKGKAYIVKDDGIKEPFIDGTLFTLGA